MFRVGIWLGPIALLAIALLDMPYGYYQILRVAIFCASAYLAIQESRQSGAFWTWSFVGCALLYNPIFRLSLGGDLWPLANLATIVLFGFHYWVRGRDRLIHRGD